MWKISCQCPWWKPWGQGEQECSAVGDRLCQGGGMLGKERTLKAGPGVPQPWWNRMRPHCQPSTAQLHLQPAIRASSSAQMCQKGEKPFRAPSEEQTPKN